MLGGCVCVHVLAVLAVHCCAPSAFDALLPLHLVFSIVAAALAPLHVFFNHTQACVLNILVPVHVCQSMVANVRSTCVSNIGFRDEIGTRFTQGCFCIVWLHSYVCEVCLEV